MHMVDLSLLQYDLAKLGLQSRQPIRGYTVFGNILMYTQDENHTNFCRQDVFRLHNMTPPQLEDISHGNA